MSVCVFVCVCVFVYVCLRVSYVSDFVGLVLYKKD